MQPRLLKARKIASATPYTLWRLGLGRWHLILVMMLCFALNRYAVSSIQGEKRELSWRWAHQEQEMQQLTLKTEQLKRQLAHYPDPRWQEMVLMRHLLLFPESSEVYWFSLDSHPGES